MAKDKFNEWCNKATDDSDLISELNSMKDNEVEINDVFYKDL